MQPITGRYPFATVGQPIACALACALLLAGCGKAGPAGTRHNQAMGPARVAGAAPGAGANEATQMAVPPMTPDDARARAAGHTLYVKMNCAGCHSYTGKGWMGPDLTDSYWRYGAAADDIYRSIYLGRPQGMPAWGQALQPEQIWQLVHYIGSLPTRPGGDPTTVSPATQASVAIDALPPAHATEAAK